jgi:hypothetical protein
MASLHNWSVEDLNKNQDLLNEIFLDVASTSEDLKRVVDEITEQIPIIDKYYKPTSDISKENFPNFYDFLITKPSIGKIIDFVINNADKSTTDKFNFNFIDFIEILIYLLFTIAFPKNKTQPFNVKTKWVDNKKNEKKCVKTTVGFSFGGGGHAAQAISAGLLSGLNARNLLNDRAIDYLIYVSGSAWTGGPLGYQRFGVDGREISAASLDSLLLPYIAPENLKITDLLVKKPKNYIINNASDTIYVLRLLNNFLKNLLDPDVPFQFVLSNTFAMPSLEQFNLYSTKSILQKDRQELYETFTVLKNEEIRKKIDSVYLLRPDFPDTYTTIMGSWPQVSGNGEYNYFNLNMNSNSYGAIARDAYVENPKDANEKIHIGERISNYAFGSKLIEVIDSKEKIILSEVNGVQSLASLNQMVGLASCAFAPFFNFSNNSTLNLLNTRYNINSEITNPNQKAFLSDGGQYDNSGILSLVALRTQHIFAVISAGERILPAEGKYPKQLTDPFALSKGSEKRNLSAVLNPNDFDATVAGILASESGVFTKKYSTLESEINGSVIPSYEVSITWIYIDISTWQSNIKNPVLKRLVDFIPSFPFNNSIFQRINLLPVTANAYNYYMAYIAYNYLAPILSSIDRSNICPIPPPCPPCPPTPPRPDCEPSKSLLRKKCKCKCTKN